LALPLALCAAPERVEKGHNLVGRALGPASAPSLELWSFLRSHGLPTVRTLYLLRHAKSSWDDSSLPDHERPLAPRGQRDAKRLAGYLSGSAAGPS
jgi:hypothetical protein